MRLKLLLTIAVLISASALAQPDDAATRVIVLGTGNPTADYRRAGAGIAVIHRGQAYLFDVGAGTVLRAIEASQRLGIAELEPTRINHLFVTHLHSDHLHDFAELGGTRWWERPQPLEAWGPGDFGTLAAHAVGMLEVEARVRKAGTPAAAIPNPDGYRIEAHEIEPGPVFEDEGIEIEAFTVPHGEIRPALGYKITTEDRTIVVSGDTGFSTDLMEKAKGADLLFHEVISASALKGMADYWQDYHGTSHTPTDQLAKLASGAQPGTLVLYHIIFLGRDEQELLEEVSSAYPGKVVLASDLDVF